MKPIVINKFRLGDRSERVSALADEWGCSVTVATARLLDAGLAAVDRDESLTPQAIRAAFEYGKASRVLPDPFVKNEFGVIPPQTAPTLPVTAGKRMFDQATQHAIAQISSLDEDQLRTAILNGYPVEYHNKFGMPLDHKFGLYITDATRDAMSGKGSFVCPKCGGLCNGYGNGCECLPGANEELCADEACPGCGCLPGDGVTDGCEHPDGCGYYEDQDPRSMGWVGDNGLP